MGSRSTNTASNQPSTTQPNKSTTIINTIVSLAIITPQHDDTQILIVHNDARRLHDKGNHSQDIVRGIYSDEGRNRTFTKARFHTPVPPSSATPEQLEAYHQKHSSTGNFDPVSIIRRTQ